MASVNSISPQRFLPLAKPIKENKPNNLHFQVKGLSGSSLNVRISKRRRNWNIGSSMTEEFNVIPVQTSDPIDQQPQFGELNGYSSSSSSSSGSALETHSRVEEEEDFDKLVDRAINATIVLAAGSFAISKLLTIDRDYWHGWTIYEILRYAPLHNWAAYEEVLKENPVFAKMVISGVVYSIGDWIAQCYEGKPLFDFDRTRMFRSGLVGFSLHGSLSHYYYQFCEALFPFQDWWVVPVKVAFDQTAWAALWNSIYFVVLGFLRFESPVNIFTELKATFFPMLTAGWKLWPFAHLITYGVIPIEQRLLWVDCVELIWVTILSTLSNEKSEARSSEASLETNHIPIPITSEDQVKSTESDQL